MLAGTCCRGARSRRAGAAASARAAPATRAPRAHAALPHDGHMLVHIFCTIFMCARIGTCGWSARAADVLVRRACAHLRRACVMVVVTVAIAVVLAVA